MLKKLLRKWLEIPTETYPRPLRIAVLGDSLSCQNYLMPQAWPSIVEGYMRQSAADVQIFNCSFGGHNFYRALNNPVFGRNTAIQHLLGLKPDIVLVALGYNDTISKNDGRSMMELKSDVIEVTRALRGLKVLYIPEIPPPGISGMADWIELDTFIKARFDTNEFLNFDLGHIYEMGGALPDGLHLNAGGTVFQAASITKGLGYSGLIPNLPILGTPERNFTDAFYIAFKNPSPSNQHHIDSVFAGLHLKVE